MKGVILSGGKGTRLAPVTLECPKQLLPIMGKPILFYSIEYLIKADIHDICIIISRETGDAIKEAVSATDFDANFTFVVQPEPLGLAHAVGMTKEFIGDSEDFVVLLGDNLFDKDLKDMIKTFKSTDASSLVILKYVDSPCAYGVVEFDEKTGQAKKLVEKPQNFVSNYAIVGVYLFKKEIFEAIEKLNPSSRGELEITDALASQVSLGQNVQTYILDSYWYDTGTLTGLIDSNRRLLLHTKKFDNFNAKVTNSYVLGDVTLDKDTKVTNSNLMGPIYVGKNVKITNSVIGPFTSIGDNCVIDNAEIQQSIIMQDTEIEGTQIISSFVYKDSIFQRQPMVLDKVYKEANGN